MPQHFKLIIVIPCYNEAERLPVSKYKTFIDSHPFVKLCFVNDGSIDSTLPKLLQLRKCNQAQIKIINQVKNKGKANTVRHGILTCQKSESFDRIAYLDADLSTSLKECYAISKNINKSTLFTFGSRIPLETNHIVRKEYRFWIGRIVAKSISRQLDLDIYDTQCGCKVFHHGIVNFLFQEKFMSRWLFDVEIFHRFKTLALYNNMSPVFKEIPLKEWIDTDDSRVPFSYGIKLWIDLLSIGNNYKYDAKTNRKNETIITT